MRIPVQKTADGESILAGSRAGKRLFGRLVEIIVPVRAAVPLYLDFVGIEAATASYLRESIVALNSYNLSRNNNLFVVAANAEDPVEEELEFCLKAQNGIMLSCSLGDRNQVSKVRLLGSLDSKLEPAFSYVYENGEGDAATIWQHFREQEPIKINAWNNRLAALSALGVVIEEARGRGKYYRPVVMES
jgi:hypothetical protein